MRPAARGAKAVAMAIALSRRYEAHVAALIGERKMAQLRAHLLEVYTALDGAPAP